MNYTHPTFILCAAAFILTLISFAWPLPWQVPMLLIAIALMLPRG